MKHLMLALLLAAALPCAMARADDASPPPDELTVTEPGDSIPPMYIKTDFGFAGFWPHGDKEYVRFDVRGDAVQVQDSFHLLLNPNQGMMLTYADKSHFKKKKGGLLKAHRDWEINFWRNRLGEVHDKNRPDLARGRKDIMVTELIVPEGGGKELKAYMISLAGPDGVYVFSLSPVSGKDDAMVKKFIASVQRVHHALNIGLESRLIRDEAQKGKKKGK